MTSLDVREPAARIAISDQLNEVTRSDLLEHAAMVVLLAFWAMPFTKAIGGRGVHTELLFAFVLIPSLLLMRVWQSAPRSLALAAILAGAALCVCRFTPSGWWGSDVAAAYVLSAAVFVIARRYVRTEQRVEFVAAAICLAAVYEFGQGFLPWWGGRDPSITMAGSFDWHNPFAAYLLPAALVGIGLTATGRSPWRLVGWFSVPLSCAGIVFSSSRATLAALIVGIVLVLAASVRARQGVKRCLAVIALAVTVCAAMPGPPLFSHYTSPFAAAAARSAGGETLAQNGFYRTEFWREATNVARHRPLAGSGFHNLATASALYTPSGWARSQLAHNGYLQPLSDGGLLLGIPFLLLIALIGVWALRRLWSTFARQAELAEDLLVGAIAIGVLAALAHSAVDFDWSHPTILIELMLMAACVAPVARGRDEYRPGITQRIVAAGSVAILVASLGLSVAALHQWQREQATTLQSPAELLRNASAPFGDYRPAQQLLYDVRDGTRPASTPQVKSALGLTAAQAGVDLHLALLRDAVAAKIGAGAAAVQQARRSLSVVTGSTAPYQLDLALVMVDADQRSNAEALLTANIASQVDSKLAAPDLGQVLLFWAQRLGRGSSYACQLDAVRDLPLAPDLSALPKPTAPCLSEIDQGGSSASRSQSMPLKSKGTS